MKIELSPAKLAEAHQHADRLARAHNAGTRGTVVGGWIVWTVAGFPAVLIRNDANAWDANGNETHGRYWTVTADKWSDNEAENIASVILAAQ